jgi:hypothetical protein
MRYFFHVQMKEKFLLDETGMELLNTEAAYEEAIGVCRELAMDFPAACRDIVFERVRVTDEVGAELFAVPTEH